MRQDSIREGVGGVNACTHTLITYHLKGHTHTQTKQCNTLRSKYTHNHNLSLSQSLLGKWWVCVSMRDCLRVCIWLLEGGQQQQLSRELGFQHRSEEICFILIWLQQEASVCSWSDAIVTQTEHNHKHRPITGPALTCFHPEGRRGVLADHWSFFSAF